MVKKMLKTFHGSLLLVVEYLVWPQPQLWLREESKISGKKKKKVFG
jgi:hypothetical protein